MGREFDYDVKIMGYDCTKTPNIVITFYNDIHHVLDCNRVNIIVDGDRVIFKPGDNSKNSIKFSGKFEHSQKLMTSKNYEELSKFIGVYDLQYDQLSGFYFISTETWRLASTQEDYGYRKGKQQFQHNVGNNKGPKEVFIEHTKPHIEKEKNMDNQTIRKTSAEKNAEAVVRSALLQLMETQLKEEKCAEALATLTTLKNYI